MVDSDYTYHTLQVWKILLSLKATARLCFERVYLVLVWLQTPRQAPTPNTAGHDGTGLGMNLIQ